MKIPSISQSLLVRSTVTWKSNHIIGSHHIGLQIKSVIISSVFDKENIKGSDNLMRGGYSEVIMLKIIMMVMVIVMMIMVSSKCIR